MHSPLVDRFRELIPAIMNRWDDRVRAEVVAAGSQTEAFLRDSLHLMLEVLAKILAKETDPKTAARDLAYITLHAEDRARQPGYSLGEVIRECQILLEVVLEILNLDHPLAASDNVAITKYFNEMVSISADEYLRVQQEVLQAHVEKLSTMHRSKDEFLAMLSHELRNPLGAISNSLILLRDGSERGELPEFALDIAQRQTAYMKRMVDDLLDLSRITEGRVVLNPEPLDLGLVVQDAVEAARSLIGQRRHAVSVSRPRERIYVHGDPVRIGQCLSNLLTNAAKYTDPGGHIQVSLERKRIASPDSGARRWNWNRHRSLAQSVRSFSASRAQSRTIGAGTWHRFDGGTATG